MIGQEIKKARIKKGLTQLQLADLLGCTKGYICNIERGRQNVSSKKITEIAVALGFKFVQKMILK